MLSAPYWKRTQGGFLEYRYKKPPMIAIKVNRIRKLSMDVLGKHRQDFGVNFSDNKKALDRVSIIRSKGLKNEMAGFITKFVKNEIREQQEKEYREKHSTETTRPARHGDSGGKTPAGDEPPAPPPSGDDPGRKTPAGDEPPAPPPSGDDPGSAAPAGAQADSDNPPASG